MWPVSFSINTNTPGKVLFLENISIDALDKKEKREMKKDNPYKCHCPSESSNCIPILARNNPSLKGAVVAAL